MHGGHWGGERIPRTCWPPTDDESLRYEFGAPPFLNFLWIPYSIKGRQWRELILAAHPDSYKHYQCNLAGQQRGTCALRGKKQLRGRRVRNTKFQWQRSKFAFQRARRLLFFPRAMRGPGRGGTPSSSAEWQRIEKPPSKKHKQQRASGPLVA